MNQFLLIDGPYYTFYRYFALLQWYRHRKAIDELKTPEGVEKFIDKFRELFSKKMKEVIKKLKLENPIIIAGLDCPRTDIWRKSLFPEYKAHRHAVLGEEYVETELFKIMRNEELFKQAGAHMLLRHPKLEADDCLALCVRNIRRVQPKASITIITSDLDYLQLADETTRLFNLKYKDLTESKNSFKDKEKDLFCKIVAGDKSDGIPGIFKKCGIKTASKYYENRTLFEEKLKQENAGELFQKNKQLIDFDMIPQQYVDEFNSGKYTTNYTQPDI